MSQQDVTRWVDPDTGVVITGSADQVAFLAGSYIPAPEAPAPGEGEKVPARGKKPSRKE